MTTKIKFLKPDDDSFSSERDALSVDDAVSTFIFNPHHSLSLQSQRERLPIRNYRDRILYCLENYQTLVLVGETGSGKSTQVPQFLKFHHDQATSTTDLRRQNSNILIYSSSKTNIRPNVRPPTYLTEMQINFDPTKITFFTDNRNKSESMNH